MVILPSLPIFFEGGYLTYIFLLLFAFGLFFRLLGVRYGH